MAPPTSLWAKEGNRAAHRARRLAAASGVLALGLGGLVVTGAAPASAATSVTPFGFAASAYGTRVTSPQPALSSGRTAWSYLSCTKLAGKRVNNHLASADAPSGNPLVSIGTVDTDNSTYRQPARRIVGTVSHSTIASVTLRGATVAGLPGPVLQLDGLTTEARAWSRAGVFGSSTRLGAGDISLTGVAPTVGGPLGDLLHGVDQGIDGVVDALQANGGAIEVPGLGVLRLGDESTRRGKLSASATASSLKVTLYGQDLSNPGDDSTMVIGHSWAQINRGVTAGPMAGGGTALSASLLDGTITTGNVAVQPLPCQGTGGQVRTNPTASLDLLGLGLFEVGALQSRSYGVQRRDRSGTAWTEGQVASVAVGSGSNRLEITGITGRANVSKSRRGRISTSTQGTEVASITVGGTARDVAPGETLTVPGVAQVELGRTTRSPRGISVTAVRITLLADSAGQSVINLGSAKAFIRRN